MWLWTDIFPASSELLCTLREISKRWSNNDMDQLSFCMFSLKHGPQMDQKQTRVLTIGFFKHTALMQIWEETVANLPVWISIAQKFFSILL